MEAIVYTSFLTEEYDESVLEQILSVAQEKNRSREITGCLIYRNGIFLQLLEGKDKDISALYESISKDKRHENMAKLYHGPIETRLFPEWSMAFREGREIQFDWVNEILSLGSKLKKPDGKKYLKVFQDLANQDVAA